MIRALLCSLLLFAPQAQGVDLDKILEKADKLLEEAKAGYESARDRNSAAGFVDAGFKLEEARIKYVVLQEIGGPERQKTAADRLRAVNQLAKLLHDGRVAVSGAGAETPAPKAAEADPAAPAPAPKPRAEVRARIPVPEAAPLKEAEKAIREVFRDQFAKKSPGDRQQLARLLLEQVPRMHNDPAALWILYREAQDAAASVCDLRTLQAAVDGAAAAFDVDATALRFAALTAAGRNAKTAEDFGGLARALLQVVDEYVATDQYDPADKAVTAAAGHARKSNDVALSVRATTRARDVAEAKARYAAMKGALETLAKNPDDPAANNELGQLLCFIKGNWELGIRFLVKGSDPALKALAEKELAKPALAADQAAIGDGWWDQAEKEKSALRKTQMQVHACGFYEAALPGLNDLLRLKVEKRLDSVDSVPREPIDLLRLIDPAKDTAEGSWTLNVDRLTSDASIAPRIEFPYEPPPEYDFKISFIRNDGMSDVFMYLTRNGKSFAWAMACGPERVGFGDYKGQWASENTAASVPIPGGIVNGRVHTSLIQVRRDSLRGYLDGKLIKELKDPYADLTPHTGLRLRNDSLLGVGSYQSSTTFLKAELLEISGRGRKTRP